MLHWEKMDGGMALVQQQVLVVSLPCAEQQYAPLSAQFSRFDRGPDLGRAVPGGALMHVPAMWANTRQGSDNVA